MSENFSKERILKNSLLLYVRMLFTMWLNLYATRLTLANLGVEDMGVYGVVGSIVSLFMILSSGVGAAIQRFITFELGKLKGNLNRVFCSSLNVIFIIATIVLLLLEIIGSWMLNNSVNIPENSMPAAQWVFQFSVLTCIVNIISIPYNALVIAHEKMNAFAFISILQTITTCVAAYCLSYLNDRLFFYALFIAIISILIRLIYQIYCVVNFPEAKYHKVLDKVLIKELLGFSGISTISGILQVILGQGITFVINWTFGVALNAVYSIALQLKNSLLSFAQNIQKAIAPQITKTYAGGELERYKKLIYEGSKMEIFMVYFIMIPFLFRTEYIMSLWLGNLPEHTIVFMQCIVFLSLTYAAFEPIRTAVLATSRIAKFMLIPDLVNLLVLPASYIISKITDNPNNLILSVVGFEILACTLRTYYATKVTVIKIRDIMNKVILRSVYVAILSSAICYLLSITTKANMLGLFVLLIVNSIFLCIIIYFIGIQKSERAQINMMLRKIITICNKKGE